MNSFKCLLFTYILCEYPVSINDSSKNKSKNSLFFDKNTRDLLILSREEIFFSIFSLKIRAIDSN